MVDKSWRGGNIVFNSIDKRSDNELVLRAEYEKELSLPKYIVGMDVNQKPENWVTFSEPMENGKVTLPKPDSVASIEKQRDDFNKKLRPSKRTVVEYKLNSGQRRRMYRRLQKKMVNRHTAIESEIIPILQYFKDKYNDEFGLAIDGVATGARSKSFGQEDIRDACVRWCIKNNVPFVIVPPQYTSQKCVKCGTFHKQDRKTSNTYLCGSCGFFHKNCDAIGALNIKVHGEFLLNKFAVTSSSLSTKINKKSLKDIYGAALREEFNFPQS